ncbi:MAG: S9 family peptidase, partial [Micromonosporaceae bacterium]
MPPRSVFHDVAEFVALPRLTRLVLSPDGTRLVACVEQATEDRDRYRSSLWELDPAGVEPPRRLTHSEQGESSPAFVGDGSLLFTSTRPGPQGDPPDVPALWLLPPRGDAVRVATSPGGLSGPVGARASTAYVVATSRLRDADAEEDERWRRDRDRAKVTAILHDGFPVRHWDHDLGPDFPRLLAARTDDGTPPRDLAPDAGPALVEASYSLTPDGTTLVTTWTVREPRGRTRTGLVAIDVATGDRRTVVEEADVDYRGPVVSPDGARVAAVRRAVGDVATPTTWAVYVQGLAGGPGRSFDLTEELTPTELVWSPDSSTLYVAGDRRGRGAVVALDVTTGGYRRIASDAVYSSLSVSPDGAA